MAYAVVLVLGVFIAVTNTLMMCRCCLESVQRQTPAALLCTEAKSWDFSDDCNLLLSEGRPGGTDLDIKKNGNNLINVAFHLL